ncbi:hypothetical protein KKG46_02340 [Patescibacteria group bacterium]|nr:hypothetical protein [Patescibacteria group bacterium]
MHKVTVTSAQLRELYGQIESGRITVHHLRDWLDYPKILDEKGYCCQKALILDQLVELHHRIGDRHIKRPDLQSFLDKPRIKADELIKFLSVPREFVPVEPFDTTRIFELVVDYDMSFDEMEAAGHYAYVSEGVTKATFPIFKPCSGTVAYEARLFCFNDYLSGDEARKRIEEEGYYPAEIQHLLAFGAAYPEAQLECVIYALGTLWKENEEAVSACLRLTQGSKDRELAYMLDNKYLRWVHFLAVRRVKKVV